MALSAKFKNCLRLTLGSEGGNDDDPDDTGGRTGQGITQSEYSGWLEAKGRPNADVFDIKPADRDQLYNDLYWTAVSGDKLPLPVAFLVFDAGVLSGVGHSRRLAQRVVGVRQDGILGPISIAALNAVDRETFIRRFTALRLEYLKGRPTAWKYLDGWTNRTNRNLRQALAMLKLPSQS